MTAGRNVHKWLVTAAAVAIVLTAVQAAAVEPCCFANQRYSGVCQVAPAEDETCASILTYLNTPNSTGKGYCAGTDIRGGWAQVDCQAKSQSTQATTGAAPQAACTAATAAAR
jgi:hypothetical protein